MACRQVERGPCVQDLYSAIGVAHMNCSLGDVAPVWALAGVIGQSFKERGEVGAGGHLDVADGQTGPAGVRSGQILSA